MAPRRTIEQQYDLASAALEGGGTRQSITTIAWDVAGRCEAPLPVEVIGRPSPLVKRFGESVIIDRRIDVRPGAPTPLFVDLTVKCRKCSRCLKERANYWRSRAASEIEVSTRTWFLTLTLRPDRNFYFMELCRKHRLSTGVDYDAADEDQRFRMLCAEIGRELTRFIKRVRKNSGSKFRQIFVFEKHASGAPHIHGFIHETDPEQRVSKRVIQEAWHQGFSNCKLVDRDERHLTARYATKYIAKELATRIRASKKYGEGAYTPETLLRDSVGFLRRIDSGRNVAPTSSRDRPKSKIAEQQTEGRDK